AFSTAASSSGTAGSALTVQPVIEARDASGNRVTGFTGAVTLEVYSNSTCTAAVTTNPDGGALLSATANPVTSVSGLATFANLALSRASTLYLKATSSTYETPCSGAMVISAGAFSLAKSTLTVSASTLNSGASITATLTAKDVYANSAPTGITSASFSLNSGGGSFGSVTAQGSGVYTSSYTATTSGTATIGALINGSAITDTETLTISPGTVATIEFSTQPSATGSAGTALTSQPAVEGLDAAGNRATGFTGSVTLALFSDSTCATSVTTNLDGGAALTATSNPKTAVSGLATFAALKMTRAGTFYLRGVHWRYSSSGFMDNQPGAAAGSVPG
ncbi:MAG: hypothetical protein EOP49_11505, partial [Sphingobacteriales bacterium]